MFMPVIVYGSPEAAANDAAKGDWLALAVTGYFGSIFGLSVLLGFIQRSRLQQINALVSLLLCAYFLLVGGGWARLGLPFAAELAMKPTMLLIGCADFFVLLFTREFIPPQLQHRLPSRFLVAMLVAVAVEIAVIPFMSYHGDFCLVAPMAVAVMATCTAAAWWLARLRPGGGTRLLLAAWLINLAVAVVIILELIGVMPNLLPTAMGPVVYGVTISGLFLAASTQRVHDLMREQIRTSDLEKSLAESRLLALRYQVNPHFLFNSINSAIGLIQDAPSRAVTFLYRLADFLQAALQADTSLTVPLAEEVEKLTAYLDVEKVRFGKRLDVLLDFPKDLLAFRVPELILQPLVENAIKHGQSQSAKVFRLRLLASREGDRLHLEVSNTGHWRPEAEPRATASSGIGLSNLRERLRLIYGDKAQLTLNEADGWVIARISIPTAERRPPARLD
jgi:hypothetical protein